MKWQTEVKCILYQRKDSTLFVFNSRKQTEMKQTEHLEISSKFCNPVITFLNTEMKNKYTKTSS